MSTPEFRLYIDEVGDSSFRRVEDLEHRFLCLGAVAVYLADVSGCIGPEMEQIKVRHFGAHPDDDVPIVLHRTELLNRKGPFRVLNDPARRVAFDHDLLAALRRWPFHVFTAVLDKAAFQRLPLENRPDPYHALLDALVGRYAAWLANRRARGDVMAEARGGREDRRLKEAFEHLFESARLAHADALTSRQLKVRLKAAGIPGLQLADLVALPCAGLLRARHGVGRVPQGFGAEILAVVEDGCHAHLPEDDEAAWIWLP